MNHVENWYKNGKDFDEGVALLRLAHQDVSRFSAYEGTAWIPPYTTQALQDALDQLSDEDFYQVPPTKNLTIQKDNSPLRPTQNEPPSVTLLRGEARRWHKLEAVNHEQLHQLFAKNAPEAEVAPLVIERIEIIAPALDDLYQRIKSWDTEGVAPIVHFEKPVAVQTSDDISRINALWREKNSIEPRLSKIKKQLQSKTEIIEKFERLATIHAELELPFEKKLDDYLP
jgi:hypothetical protein